MLAQASACDAWCSKRPLVGNKRL